MGEKKRRRKWDYWPYEYPYLLPLQPRVCYARCRGGDSTEDELLLRMRGPAQILVLLFSQVLIFKRRFCADLLLFQFFKSFEDLEEDFYFVLILLHGLRHFFISSIIKQIGLL